ncbi:hypothetical protein C8T65DRAFT_74425 [Cerioporus squamosus]|nr:hypothetical protein C8T65DRAFT_74425 [Cerioporus squamosus]
MRMTSDSSKMSEASTASGPPHTPLELMNIIDLTLTFGADEDIFARFPLSECTSLKSLSISGGKVGTLKRPYEAPTPAQSITLASLSLTDIETHNASDDKLRLGNVLLAVLDPVPICEIGRLIVAGPYGALYEDSEVKQPEVESTTYPKAVKLSCIVFDRRASTYDHFTYLSQVVVPRSLQTVVVKPGRWKDVEGLRVLLIVAGQFVTCLDISLTRLIENEECKDQSGSLPPWNLLADCVATCPRLQLLRLHVKPCRSGLINAAKEDFDPARYTPFGTVLSMLPRMIEQLVVRFVWRWDTQWGGLRGEGRSPIWDLHVLDAVLPSPRFPYLRGVWIEYERNEGDRSLRGIVEPIIGDTLPKLVASNRISYGEMTLSR